MSEYTDITHRAFWNMLKTDVSSYKVGAEVTHSKSGKKGTIKYKKGNSIGVLLEGNKHANTYHFKTLRHD